MKVDRIEYNTGDLGHVEIATPLGQLFVDLLI